MIWKLCAMLAFAASFLIGYVERDRQYRLDGSFQACDQAVFAHADSAYTSMTWVASQVDDYAQLRFFDKVEGGICLHPSWQELIALKDPRLAHLVPAVKPTAEAPQAGWPFEWTPDPGTVSNSPYVRLFPVGILLNRALMDPAKGDAHAVTARALVVGMGSGAGIAVLAHHFPGLAITVVDIDRKVVDIDCRHYPLIRWLSEQKLADGQPRLQFVISDARQFIESQGRHGAPLYDLIVLDAYTAGSTIPPHLMTQEFFTSCADVLAPHGCLVANVIGCYGTLSNGAIVGAKHRVLGGAIRTFRAAGLTHVMNFPVLMPWEKPGQKDIDVGQDRNNIVACSRDPIEPRGRDDATWARLEAFQLFQEVPLDTYLSRTYFLHSDAENWSSAKVDATVLEADDPTLARGFKPSNADPAYHTSYSEDETVIKSARDRVIAWAAAKRGGRIPYAWDEVHERTVLMSMDIDVVAYARATYLSSVTIARDASRNGGEALVGPIGEGDEHHAPESAIISDAPIFTDQRPNADILNH